MRFCCSILAGAALVSLLTSAALADVVSMQMVPVGNSGNAADTTGYGAVNYNYSIGKYEVTAGQYTAFLNSVASVSDPNALYNPLMGTDLFASGISRTSNGSGGFIYATTKNPSYPANFVTFWNACRFVNWLENGQPSGVQGATTTENGVYNLTVSGAISNNTVTRASGTTWALTSENEWYKAAYYDPTLNSGAGGYRSYPTHNNTAPSNLLSAVGTNNANFYGTNYTDPTNYLTQAGAFAASPSAYSTFDQGGNVWEWNEAIVADEYGSYRGLRGGALTSDVSELKSDLRYYALPTSSEGIVIGFRVTQFSVIPEPTSLALLAIGVTGMLLRKGARK
jgi:formylglycine-generating enzyme